MAYAKFTLMEKTLNLDLIEGKFNAFAKAQRAIPVRMSKPLAADGHGIAKVDGAEVSKGVTFHMNMIVSADILMVGVGEVATEYDKEYTLTLTGYRAADGTPFRDAVLKFKTLPRTDIRDHRYAEHEEVALQAAREGMILLKNDGVLPLAPDEKLNVFGSAQYLFRNTATGAGQINPRWQANFHQSVQEHSRFTVNQKVSALYRRLADVTPPQEILEQARESSDLGVILITRSSGEFLDNKPAKGGYYLTDQEQAMVRAVAGAFPRTVAIINSGYPIDLRWVEELGIGGVLYTGFAGMGAGYALMELLDGRTNPSGKLPDTWACDYYDHPSAHNFMNFREDEKLPGQMDYGVELYYEEDIYVGYRYFDTFRKPVQYPFGHGLSYTAFETICDDCCWDGKELTARFRVKNTGERAGKEVVPIYIKAPEGTLEKPCKVLAGFEKTQLLEPGQEQVLLVVCPAMHFASFDEGRNAYVLEAGCYEVLCGNGTVGCFETPEQVLRSVEPINAPVEQFHRLSQGDPQVLGLSRKVPVEERVVHKAPRKEYAPKALPKYTGPKISFEMLKTHPEMLDCFVAQLTAEELCALNVGGGANWYMPWDDGSACKNRQIRRVKMPRFKVSDGNTGLNLKKPNIGFPSSATIAATFNKNLAYDVGRVIGEESRENGIAINLGPAANLHRNILNGRHPEYFSEDPVLAGCLCAMHAMGLEDAGTGATYKHLFCNGSDTCRKASHSIVSQRALRELYYKVFDIAMTIYKPSCVMTSYNAVNGLYPAENVEVLQDLLRREWNFEGFIMTDWGTYDTVDPVEMVKAGNCWLTEGGKRHVKQLRKAMEDGQLERCVLEQNARYVIKTIMKFT